MAEKEGLQVEIYSLDKRMKEGDVDLAKDHPFKELKEEAEACNTFSRARWNMSHRGLHL